MAKQESDLPSVQEEGVNAGREKAINFSSSLRFIWSYSIEMAQKAIIDDLDLDVCKTPAMIDKERSCLGDLPSAADLKKVADKPITVEGKQIGIPLESLMELAALAEGKPVPKVGGRRKKRGGDPVADKLAKYTPRQRAVATALLMSGGVLTGAWVMGGLPTESLGAFGSLEQLLVAARLVVPPCREDSPSERYFHDRMITAAGLPETMTCARLGEEYEMALKRVWTASLAALAVGGLTWRAAWTKMQLAVLEYLGNFSDRFLTQDQLDTALAKRRAEESKQMAADIATQKEQLKHELDLAKMKAEHEEELKSIREGRSRRNVSTSPPPSALLKHSGLSFSSASSPEPKVYAEQGTEPLGQLPPSSPMPGETAGPTPTPVNAQEQAMREFLGPSVEKPEDEDSEETEGSVSDETGARPRRSARRRGRRGGRKAKKTHKKKAKKAHKKAHKKTHKKTRSGRKAKKAHKKGKRVTRRRR